MSGTPGAARPRCAVSGRFPLLAVMVTAALDLVNNALAEAQLGDTPVDLGCYSCGLVHKSSVAFSLGGALTTWVVVAH